MKRVNGLYLRWIGSRSDSTSTDRHGPLKIPTRLLPKCFMTVVLRRSSCHERTHSKGSLVSPTISVTVRIATYPSHRSLQSLCVKVGRIPVLHCPRYCFRDAQDPRKQNSNINLNETKKQLVI